MEEENKEDDEEGQFDRVKERKRGKKYMEKEMDLQELEEKEADEEFEYNQ